MYGKIYQGNCIGIIDIKIVGWCVCRIGDFEGWCYQVGFRIGFSEFVNDVIVKGFYRQVWIVLVFKCVFENLLGVVLL